MSGILLSVVSLIYLGAAVDLLMNGKYPLAACFLFYALANIALTMEATK